MQPMSSYTDEILKMIPGINKEQKLINIEKIMDLLKQIVYPRRNTKEMDLTIQNIADYLIREGLIDL